MDNQPIIENQPVFPQEEEISVKKQKTFKKILIYVLIFFALGLLVTGGYYLYTKKLTVFTPKITNSPTPTEDPTQPKVKILSIAFVPVKEGVLDTTVIDNTSGDYFMTSEQVKEKVTELNKEIASSLEEGTKYKKYLNKDAKPALKYSFYNQIVLYQNVPPSSKNYPGKTDIKLTDYYSILTKQDICKLVEEKGVNEVWIWSYVSKDRKGWKSNLSSVHGDISISDLDQGDMPICNKSYTVYEYDYGKGASDAIESHLKQYTAIFQSISLDLFWNNFVGFFTDPRDWSGNWEPYPSVNRRCGSPEWPPNSKYQGDWSNVEPVESDCLDWKPDGSGQKQGIECTLWKCNAKDYFIFWMQNIPGPDNGLIYNGNTLRNWWDFISDYDESIKLKKDLVY